MKQATNRSRKTRDRYVPEKRRQLVTAYQGARALLVCTKLGQSHTPPRHATAAGRGSKLSDDNGRYADIAQSCKYNVWKGFALHGGDGNGNDDDDDDGD